MRDDLENLGSNFAGKRSIAEIFSLALAPDSRPAEEVCQILSFGSILQFLRHQEPGKTGDGISVLARSIRNGESRV